MTNHVLTLIAKDYQKVREGVEKIMRGKILEYEASKIYDSGYDKGRIDRGEELAKKMICDGVDFSFIEKYFDLPQPRLKELVHDLSPLGRNS